MLVRFFHQTDESEEPRGEILTAVRDLGELYPDEWRALLAEATRARSERSRTSRKRPGRGRRRR
jgi:hypothetical protein